MRIKAKYLLPGHQIEGEYDYHRFDFSNPPSPDLPSLIVNNIKYFATDKYTIRPKRQLL